MLYRACQFILIFTFLLIPAAQSFGEDKKEPAAVETKTQEPTTTPQKVDVKPKARDSEISERLENILNSTGWFIEPSVQVKDGVVFLKGVARSEDYKKWASDLAHKTQDTVAIVNKMQVSKPSIRDFQPLMDGLYDQWQSFLRTLPSIIFALFILFITWLAAKVISYFLLLLMKKRRLYNPLLQKIIGMAVTFAVFLIGLYTVAHLIGLTDFALTLIGGTGLFGIVLGIAFKDITENLLASIFLSINNPFDGGDLIQIDNVTGFVQRLTIRSTHLLTLEGVYVQVPNATVYKSNILNFTSNPNRRNDFIFTIDYKASISEAQDIALKVLTDHPAVLTDPEPWVLVDNVNGSKINLKIYFWADSEKHSVVKVRSSLIRLIKNAFQEKHIHMPDDGRERVFPDGVKVELVKGEKEKKEPKVKTTKHRAVVATEAEGKLNSEADEIKEQALQSKGATEGKDLL